MMDDATRKSTSQSHKQDRVSSHIQKKPRCLRICGARPTSSFQPPPQEPTHSTGSGNGQHWIAPVRSSPTKATLPVWMLLLHPPRANHRKPKQLASHKAKTSTAPLSLLNSQTPSSSTQLQANKKIQQL